MKSFCLTPFHSVDSLKGHDMTARILMVLFSFLLAGCDQPGDDYTPPAEDVVIGDQAGGYNFFTIQEIRNAAKLRLRAMQGSGAYDILDGLTKAAPNRLAGSADDPKAVAYMVETFKNLGFDKVWVEPVTLQGWARVSTAAHVVSHNNLEFNITSLGKSASTPKGGVTADVVHFKTYEDLVAADPSEVEDKIVFTALSLTRSGNWR